MNANVDATILSFDIGTINIGTVQHARHVREMLRGVAADIQTALVAEAGGRRVVGVRVSDATDVRTTYEIGGNADRSAHVTSLSQRTAMLVIAVQSGTDTPQLIRAACTYAVPDVSAHNVLCNEILAHIGASHVEQTS